MLRHWHLVKSLSTFTCLSDTDDLMEAAVQIYLSTQDATGLSPADWILIQLKALTSPLSQIPSSKTKQTGGI